MTRPVIILDLAETPTATWEMPGPLVPEGFEWAPGSPRLRCIACGKRGYPRGPWMRSHIAGHPHECACGRKFSTLSGLRAHEKPRLCTHHHTEVPR